MTEQEVKGILVTFFRDGTKGDYLDALNKAVTELMTLNQANKNLQLPDVSGSLPLDELAKEIREMSDKEFSDRCKNFPKGNDR